MSALEFVVLDLETTCLDETEGVILEVAAVGLDGQLQEVFRYSTPITQPDGEWSASMSSFVHEMHESSGLIDDVANEASALAHPLLNVKDYQGLFIHPTIETADELLASVIGLLAEDLVVLAGSGVSHMDARWIKRHMPITASGLWHGTIDVGCMRRWYKAVIGDDLTDADSRKTHRALDDVDCHLEELHEFAALFIRDSMLRDYVFATTEQEINQ